MNEKHWRDAKDFFKLGFLHTLRFKGGLIRDLKVFPMFTGNSGRPENLGSYCRLLGIRDVDVLNLEPFRPKQGREESRYFTSASEHPTSDVFLDPDTGIAEPEQKPSRKHVTLEEVRSVVRSGLGRLALIYQDGFNRNRAGPEKEKRRQVQLSGMRAKLDQIKAKDLFCFAYFTNSTNIVLVSDETGLARLAEVQKYLLNDVRVPEQRLIGPSDEEPCMLSKTTTVVFDGQVFRPDEPLGLEANRSYRITILAEGQPKPRTAWDVLDQYSGSIEGPGDLSTEIDHYLYGTEKRHGEAS